MTEPRRRPGTGFEEFTDEMIERKVELYEEQIQHSQGRIAKARRELKRRAEKARNEKAGEGNAHR